MDGLGIRAGSPVLGRFLCRWLFGEVIHAAVCREIIRKKIEIDNIPRRTPAQGGE